MVIVYRHRRLDTNEIFYVGIGKTEKRAYIKNQRNNWWTKIINKTDYDVEIIARDLSLEDACELEMFLIEQYGRRDLGLGPLVNLTDGGETSVGYRHSEETKQKLRLVNLGKKLPKETVDKIRLIWLGKTHTDETKLKMSKSMTGIKRSGKAIENMRQAQLNRNYIPTKESREKMGINSRGSLNKRSWLILDIETGIFYESLSELYFYFSDILKINYSKLRRDIKNNNIKKFKIV